MSNHTIEIVSSGNPNRGKGDHGDDIGASKSEVCDSYAIANGQEPRGEAVVKRATQKQETSTEGCNKRDDIAHQELRTRLLAIQQPLELLYLPPPNGIGKIDCGARG